MELLVTLRNTKNFEFLHKVCDGIIVGSQFCSGYKYNIGDLRKIRTICKENGLKFYVEISNFISEDEKMDLFQYIYFLKNLDVDGIYFHDLAVYNVASSYDMTSKLIYDGQTVMCNSLDASYFLSKGINGVVLSRELTYNEVTNMVKANPNRLDMVVFGHLRMSYSRRKFLSNYFKEIDRDFENNSSRSLYLVEEKRDYKMPIIEDESGTKIYTDYIFEMYREFVELKPYLKRAIVDSMFIDEDTILYVLNNHYHMNSDNVNSLLYDLITKIPDNYSEGYLYQKTNITKDE